MDHIMVLLILLILLICGIAVCGIFAGGDIDDLNPPIIVEKIHGFYVVREDKLPGGTKQRANAVIGRIKENEVVYAGPWNGYAQVALALSCGKYGKTATVFLSKGDYWTTDLARKYGANIIVKDGATLAELENEAAEYGAKVGAYVMPFGFGSQEFKEELEKRISEAVEAADDKYVNRDTKRKIWLVAGSGTLLRALYKVFPDAHFCVVQVGKKIYKDTLEPRTTLYEAKIGFYKDAYELPPYSSPSTYDAKAWAFIKRHGAKGDIIWNVAAGNNITTT